MRQLTNTAGEVTYAKSYDPYGAVTQVSGEGQSAYGYTGESQDAASGMVYLRARYYSPSNGRFQSRDTWEGDDSSPQTLNKWSYAQNNPIVYTDPSGYCVNADGSINNWKWPWFDWGPCSSNSNSPSTTTPSPTPSPTCTPTLPPTATATPSSIQIAISYLQYSSLGTTSYNYLMAEGYTITYSTDGAGHVKGKNIQVSSTASPTYIAGTIAHEATHVSIHADGTLLEEYQAFLTGDIVRNDIIQAGYGKSSDMRNPLSVYTVDLNNPNKNQLATALNAWFGQYEKLYVTDKSQGGYGVLPPLP